MEGLRKFFSRPETLPCVDAINRGRCGATFSFVIPQFHHHADFQMNQPSIDVATPLRDDGVLCDILGLKNGALGKEELRAYWANDRRNQLIMVHDTNHPDPDKDVCALLASSTYDVTRTSVSAGPLRVNWPGDSHEHHRDHAHVWQLQKDLPCHLVAEERGGGDAWQFCNWAIELSRGQRGHLWHILQYGVPYLRSLQDWDLETMVLDYNNFERATLKWDVHNTTRCGLMAALVVWLQVQGREWREQAEPLAGQLGRSLADFERDQTFVEAALEYNAAARAAAVVPAVPGHAD